MGAGKSTVADMFQELGAVIVDADKLAREALAPEGDAYQAVIDAFGDEIKNPDDSINREALANIVFRDIDRRLLLESIVHPVVARRRNERLEQLTPDVIVIEDIPLLVEKSLADQYDQVIVVSAPVKARISRLVAQRGITPEQAKARIDSQASEAERLRVADFIVDNSGDQAQTAAQVREIWQKLRQMQPQ